MGKTLTARVIAHKNGGIWASINLRGQASEQVVTTLTEASDLLSSFGLRGLIVDDLDCVLESSVLHSLNYLFYSADRLDVLLVVTSSNMPPSEFLFACGLQSNITTNLKEFTEADINEILKKLGIRNSSTWAEYTYMVSGGGHPQLTIAFIQSMAISGWDTKELATLNTLLTGSSALDDVRRQSRERLLRELPEAARRLIERLSLKLGGFTRDLVIDLGSAVPQIKDAGIVLDSLTGAWVDQNGSDRYSLSPLLSNYAATTLTSEQRTVFHRVIADSLTKERTLDVIDVNSAMLSAWESNNKSGMFKICMAVISADSDELEQLVPYLPFFTHFKTDCVAYPSDSILSHLLRAAQLLLLNQDCNSISKLEEALDCFYKEAEKNQNNDELTNIELLIYSKLLLQESRAGLGVNFLSVINELMKLIESGYGGFLTEDLEDKEASKVKGFSPIRAMFINQTSQLTTINDLRNVFDYLDKCSIELRSSLLTPLERDDFGVDVMVAGAWLSEHYENTIEPIAHSEIFAQLEQKAMGWGYTGLAVCCRKYRAIILGPVNTNFVKIIG